MLLLEMLDHLAQGCEYLISFNDLRDYSDTTIHKTIQFEEVSRVGDYSIGIARWSGRGELRPEECVVYLAVPESLTWSSTIISPVILKKFWIVSNRTDELWVDPERNWWQKLHRRGSHAPPRRRQGTYTLEEAVDAARKYAEELHGITQEQQRQITELVKEMRFRDEALQELKLA